MLPFIVEKYKKQLPLLPCITFTCIFFTAMPYQLDCQITLLGCLIRFTAKQTWLLQGLNLKFISTKVASRVKSRVSTHMNAFVFTSTEDIMIMMIWWVLYCYQNISYHHPTWWDVYFKLILKMHVMFVC